MVNDNENLDKTMEDLMSKIPSHDVINQYVDLLNLEMKAIKTVWEPFMHGSAGNNPLITNHMTMIVSQYEQLLKVAAMMKSPEMMSQFLDTLKEDPTVPDMVKGFNEVTSHKHDHHHKK